MSWYLHYSAKWIWIFLSLELCYHPSHFNPLHLSYNISLADGWSDNIGDGSDLPWHDGLYSGIYIVCCVTYSYYRRRAPESLNLRNLAKQDLVTEIDSSQRQILKNLINDISEETTLRENSCNFI